MNAAAAPAWVEPLRRAGFPTEAILLLDFETFYSSEYTLKSLPTIEYIMDERYEELGLAWGIWLAGGEPEFGWIVDPRSFVADLRKRFGPGFERCTTVMQNGRFDGSILAFRHDIVPKYTVDTMGLSLHVDPYARPNLANQCVRLGLPPKGETPHSEWTRRKRWTKKGGRGKFRRMPVRVPTMTLVQEVSLKDYALNDARREWDIFEMLLPLLSRPEIELPLMQHTLEMFWQPSLRVDAVRAEEIASAMQKMIDDAIAKTGRTVEEISGDGSFFDLLKGLMAEFGEDPPTKPNKNGDPILALAKTDYQRDALLKHPNERVRDLVTARVTLEGWRSKAGRVRKIASQARCGGGRLPVPLTYYGAHTGRWSGADDINLQNLGARGHELDAAVRTILMPPEDHVLVSVDATAIEARVLAWLAGEAPLVARFKAGADVYVEFATAVLKKTIRKARKTDPPPIAKLMTKGRALGKVGILGCGYGMGASKCQSYAPGYGIALSMDEATNLVQTYRARHPQITRFWRDLERGFKYTCLYHKPCKVRCLNLRWEEHAGVPVTIIRLPSGRDLRYPHAAVRNPGADFDEYISLPDLEKGRYATVPVHWKRTWGGSLTENVVQAISRDVLGDAILPVERAGFRVPLHVHDEIVAIAPRAAGEEALRTVIDALRREPAWALGCPLDAEGRILERYEK